MLAVTSAQVGLIIHKEKIFGIFKTNSSNTNPITLSRSPLEEVQSFTYLGSIIDQHGGTEADVKARTGKTRGAFIQLKNIWASRELTLTTKIRLFNSNVKSVLLYGAETWRTTKATNSKIQTFIKPVSEGFSTFNGLTLSVTPIYGKGHGNFQWR